MTAVAPPPNFQNLNRQAWGQSNTSSNGLPSMSDDVVSRMVMPPRKTATRSNSSSSLSSISSTASTLTNASAGSTGSAASANGEAASRKRPSRYLWPMSKAEPTAGISTARTQSMTSNSGQPAASAISALQNGALNSANGTASNGARGQITDNTPILYLTPLNGTFERKTISVPTYPDVIKIGRQTNAKTVPSPYNGFFDSKVLSRSHAEIWADRNGQVWIRDVKSSNGTFINGQRLSQENKDSDPKEISDGDSLELGIDIVSEDQKTVVHHKVAARVEHAGFVSSSTLIDLNLPVNDLDPSNQHNQLVNQAMGHIRRKSGQSDSMSMRNNMATPGMTSNYVPPHLRGNIWLQPPNMEMAIKRLTAEYKMAQQQSHELQRSAQFLDNIINATTPPQDSTSPPLGLSQDPRRSSVLVKDTGLKSRFAEPPNPPPQAPLPEKPTDVSGNLGGFKRSDTEKPKIPNGTSTGSLRVDAGTATQIATLSDALAASKKEFENQSKRLREMENMLVEERVKRENAEARAQRLEKRGVAVSTDNIQRLSDSSNKAEGDENDSNTPIEDEATSEIGKKPPPQASTSQSATEKLQKRFDLLLAEFQEVKQSAEKWKCEKEVAEKERDEERKEKTSLMEMVEKLRKEEQERQTKKDNKQEKRKASKKDIPQGDSTADQEETAADDADNDPPSMDPETLKSKPISLPNGHFTSSLLQSHSRNGGTATKRADGQFVQAAPYLSAMSVVLVGVAIMAMINKMSNGEK